MSYAVVMGDDVVRALKLLPEPELQEFVLDRIDDLAARPAELSEPARFPYPAGQAYYFERSAGGTYDAFLVLFKFSQDETSLHIISLSWLRTV